MLKYGNFIFILLDYNYQSIDSKSVDSQTKSDSVESKEDSKTKSYSVQSKEDSIITEFISKDTLYLRSIISNK